MANKKLGIDVEINYPAAKEVKSAIEAALKNSGAEAEVKISVESDSLKAMRNKIKQYLNSSDFEVELKLDTTKAMANIKEVRDGVDSLIKAVNNDMEFKFTGVEKQSQNIKEMSKDIDSVTKKQKQSDDGKMSKLREIMSTQKELNSLQVKQLSSGAQEQSIYNKRIEETVLQLQLAKNEYKAAFSSNSNDNWMLDNVEAIGKFNVELKEAQQTQKQREQELKEYTALLNEEYKLEKEIQTAGEKQSQLLSEQADKVRDKQSSLLEEYNLFQRLNAGQVEKLNHLRQENDFQLQNNKLKREDADLAKRQSSSYRELKSDLNEIHKIQMKVNDLQAKSDKGVATGKEETTLRSLQQQLILRNNLYETSVNEAKAQDGITREIEDSLSSLRSQQREKEAISQETANLNADLQKTNSLYDEIESSVSRVTNLTRDLARAGDNEANVIRDAIRAEEDKQNSIRETLQAQNRVNNAREEEISTIRRATAEQSQLNTERSQAKQTDTYNQNASIGMFDPSTVYNEGKQAAMEIYTVVAELDKQIVNIEKVADASEAEMDSFKSNVFDFAADVGKSAEEYATSVERWVTAGFSLADGMNMAKQSSIGAFVGNIDEAAMVDYMSVPLVAFKDSAIGASDVLNTMNEVANQNAIEMDDLGAAYKKSAGTAATAGTSFAELTGMVTAAQESTRQGGDVIGTALKAIDINFSKMSAKLTDSDIKKFDFFKEMGINIQDSNGELRSTYDIIGDLSGRWDTMNAQEKSTALFYAGGKNHAATLQGIATNWDVVAKATGEASEQIGLVDKESGSAYQEFAKQQNSVEYSVAGLKDAWAEFIYEISGGREGVRAVIDQLKELVDVGTALAKNDTFMKFAKTFLKATLWLTANAAINKVFTTLYGGLKSTMGIFAPLTSGMGGVATKAATSAKSVSGLSSAFGLAKGVVGKFIPIVGGVLAVLSVLDLLGIDVIGTFKDMFDGTSQLSDTLEEYEKTVAKTSQTIKNNSLINEEFKEVDGLIGKYEELNKQKEKNSEETNQANKKNGNNQPEAKPHYTTDEFSLLKEEFNATAEALDLDLKITFNDYAHIKQQLDELERQKEELEAESANELITSIREQNKLPTNPITYDDEYEKKQKQLKSKQSISLSNGDIEMAELYKKQLEEMTRLNDQYTNELFSSEQFKADSKNREEMIKNAKTTRDELLKIHDSLKPADLGGEGSFFAAQELLPSLAELTSKTKGFEAIGNEISNTGELTQEQIRTIAALAPEYGNLDSQVSNWSDSDREGVQAAINGQKELDAETTKSVDSRIRALLAYANVPADEIESAMQRVQGSSSEMISLMGELGETGRLFLGVSEEALAVYGDKWDDVMISMQEKVEKLPEEVVTKYNLLTDDGLFNWDVVDSVLALPDSITTEYELLDDNNVPIIENIVDMLDDIPEDMITKYELRDSDGSINLEKLSKALADLPEEEVIQIFADASNFNPTADTIVRKTGEIGSQKPIVAIGADDTSYGLKHQDVLGQINTLSQEEAKPDINANTAPYADKDKVVREKIRLMDLEKATPTFDGDKKLFDAVNNDVDKKVAKKRTVEVTFLGKLKKAWDGTFWNPKNWGGSETIEVQSPSSQSVTTPNIGGALGRGSSQSVGVSQSQGVQQATSNSSYNSNYRDDRAPATVDSDVWRYWAKELFKGIPLENSMEELNKSISNAGDNHKQLIELYKKQIKQVDQQIAYEKDMKNAQQSEMNSLLSQLRKEGFKTSGNQVTNLGIAKNMKGEKAEKATDLLTQWETLYRALDATNNKIKDLNQDKLDINGSIKDTNEAMKQADMDKELENIEKSLKRTEALLTAIENDTDIFSSKLGMISDADFELKMTVTEEGANKSVQNIKTLTDEFNRLSKSSIKYGDNADGVQSQMESLRTEILSNADSIIDYRNALKELELERMASDFDKFAATIETNLGKISNNIDNLREGLVSGQGLGDLASSDLTGIDFTRKTGLERQYEQRLNLEKELNEALDGFAKKNIDRAKNVATATLTVEKEKYSELLKLANGYSNGKIESVSISSPVVGIGKTKQETPQDKNYQAWLKNLQSINNGYVASYNAMISKYDKAMAKAKTKSEKEALSNAMILEQLKLQENIYQSMIGSNNDAIKQTEKMLTDSSLTTEQREALLDNIENYKQSNIDAQNSIKDSIQSRFDLEFEMLDKLTDKASEYSTELSNMKDIAEAVNSGKDVMDGLYKAIFQGKINEYANATSIIEDLVKEQSKFSEGSFEWNTLQGKIEDVQESLSGLTLDILNANKDILGSQLDIIQEASEKLTLGGLDADGYDKYKDAWMDGIEKELELEKLRIKLAGLEDKSLQGKLELMDRQEKVSRAELDYADKQLEAVRLQEKLNNINGERNIQTLSKDANGDFQWEYVADQTQYDSTKEELNKVKLELEQYRDEQKRAYVDQMNDIIGNVRDGEYKDVGELVKDIDNVNDMFDDILKDIKGMSLYDTDKIIQAYQDYLKNNQNIVNEATGGTGMNDSISAIGSKFEQTFINVTTNLGKIIADELKKALSYTPSKTDSGIVIQNQTLEFPNVVDSSGLEEAFKELPQLAKQIITSK